MTNSSPALSHGFIEQRRLRLPFEQTALEIEATFCPTETALNRVALDHFRGNALQGIIHLPEDIAREFELWKRSQTGSRFQRQAPSSLKELFSHPSKGAPHRAPDGIKLFQSLKEIGAYSPAHPGFSLVQSMAGCKLEDQSMLCNPDHSYMCDP